MGKPARSKDVRRIVDACVALGGEVTFTRNQHLRVKGPKGIAIAQSNLDGPNSLRGAVAEIVRHAGLDIRAAVLRKGGA